MRLRLSLMYGALFLMFGVQMPYLPVWLDWKGLGADEIAFLLAVPMMLRLAFMPVLGAWADASGDSIGVARALAISALAFTLMLASGVGGWGLYVLVVAMMICAPSLIPVSETLAMAAVRRGQVDYGKVRLWGSATFIVANVGAGLVIDMHGGSSVIWMLVAGNALTVLVLLGNWKSSDEGGQARRSARLGGIRLDGARQLLTDKPFVLLLLAAGVLQASHAVFYVYGVLHWRSLGYSAGLIGFLWAIGVIAEIVLFTVAGRCLAIAGAVGLIVLGGAASVIRWGAMAFDPVLWVLVFLQLSHALTYAATHMGTMHLVSRIVPNDLAGTAQALLAAFTASVAMSAAVMIAGFFYVRVEGLSYLAMAVIALGGTGLALLLRPLVSSDLDGRARLV